MFPAVVQIDGRDSHNNLTVGVQVAGVHELDDLVDALLGAVHLPVAADEKLTTHLD